MLMGDDDPEETWVAAATAAVAIVLTALLGRAARQRGRPVVRTEIFMLKR